MKKMDPSRRFGFSPSLEGNAPGDAWRSPNGLADETFEYRVQRLDWHDLKLFLDVAEAGSLRAGATLTGRSVNTLRRRIGRIEDSLGCLVARRSLEGFKLTDEGRELLRVTRNMRIFSRATRPPHDAERKLKGELRIAVTEGLGTFWLMPRLVEFHHANPELRVQLDCDMRRVNMHNHEHDIAVQLSPPADPGLMSLRLGTLHLMPFASESYLRKAGIPKSVDDWRGHELVWQEADQVASELLPHFIGTSDPGPLIGITTNNSSAHFRAVAKGGGIGFLPTYARAITKRVRPIDIGVQLRREIFCVYHPDQKRTRAMQRAIAWLRASFSSRDYPWFADEFVHPSSFDRPFSDAVVVSLFEGFIEDPDS